EDGDGRRIEDGGGQDDLSLARVERGGAERRQPCRVGRLFGRIEHTVAVRIEVVEQIALPRRRGRRRHQPRVAPAEAEPLKTAEAEDLVAKTRKARRRAIMVLAIWRFLIP